VTKSVEWPKLKSFVNSKCGPG